MKLHGDRLRLRRLELGLTTRELARSSGVSQTLIKRLEETGDAAAILCGTLQRILDALGASVSEVLCEKGTSVGVETDTVARLGALVLERTSAISIPQVAHLLEVDRSDVEDGLRELAARVDSVGIRIRQRFGGVRLVPAVRAENDNMKMTRHLAALTDADVALLHRCYHRKATLRSIAATTNGNVSLHRLLGAGLLAIDQEDQIQLGSTAKDALRDATGTQAGPSPGQARPRHRAAAAHGMT